LEARVLHEALAALENGAPRLISYQMADPARGDPGVCGGQMEVYVEPVRPPITVVVVGAGHVGQAVAGLAKWLGLRLHVSDDREEFCTPEVVPDADGYHPIPMSGLPEALRVTSRTYFVLCTRNVEVDVAGLPALLETPAPYIGVIGSRRRWATTREKLLAAGVAEEALDRVHSPMGLELNAETPNEIAVSILAEIIMLSRGGHGRPMAASREG
jgi:xanthine dehydrogenase accessory factor